MSRTGDEGDDFNSSDDEGDELDTAEELRLLRKDLKDLRGSLATFNLLLRGARKAYSKAVRDKDTKQIASTKEALEFQLSQVELINRNITVAKTSITALTDETEDKGPSNKHLD